MSFSQDVWDRNINLYESILNLSFNQELANGTLNKAAFSHYIIQDSHYLLAYGRALSICAAKAHDACDVIQFARAAQDAVVTERGLHKEFMAFFNISKNEFETAPLSLATHHYISFLTSIAWSESYPVVLAALLPCFWIYAQVGLNISEKSSPYNPYQAWIDTYSSDEFHLVVSKVIHTVDHIASRCDKDTIAKMHEAYTMGARLEWLFWESAYEQRNWGPQLDDLLCASGHAKNELDLFHI